jgi:hypothetical protein
MDTKPIKFTRIIRIPLVIFAAISHISSVSAENNPPCDKCKVEVEPSPSNSDIRTEIGTPQKSSRAGYDITVTWTATQDPKGAYLPECDNVRKEGLRSFDAFYFPKKMKKVYHLSLGERLSVMSDKFQVRYFDPCTSAFKIGASNCSS